jgi:hypothetical protein
MFNEPTAAFTLMPVVRLMSPRRHPPAWWRKDAQRQRRSKALWRGDIGVMRCAAAWRLKRRCPPPSMAMNARVRPTILFTVLA